MWAVKVGSLADDLATSIAVDVAGNVYTTGYWQGTCDFDPGAGIFNLTAANTDMFVLKLGLFALPVKLLTFEVAKNANDVYLSWVTSTESNTDKFEIERSDDGISFTTIGSVKASGNSNSLRAYNFSDKKVGIYFPNENLYYRLKLVDLDDRYIYSSVKSVSFLRNLVSIHVYPNPSSHKVRIDVSAAQVGSVYSVTDQGGRRIVNGKINNPTTEIDISPLAAGVYFVTVGEMKPVKIVKQ